MSVRASLSPVPGAPSAITRPAPVDPTGRAGAPGSDLPDTRATVLLLAALAALGQFASNVYTPSLPAVARDLSVSVAAAQTTYAAFLAAFALALLGWGPIADRFGRRRALFGGIALFLLGTLGCAVAGSLETLVGARVVQATGAAAGLVVSRAVTRDRFEGPALARTLAAVTIAFALVPGLVPLLGGLVQSAAGWRATFVVTFVAAIGVAAWAARSLPETRSTGTLPTSSAAVYRRLLRDRAFVAPVLAVGGVYAALSAFFAASPALFIDRLGVGVAEYGLYPPLAVSGFVLGGLLVRRGFADATPRRIARTGLGVLALGAALLLGPPLAGLIHVHAFNAAMIVFVTGLGVFLPAAIALALGASATHAGRAAALQGFVQMGCGALGALAVGALQTSLPVLAMPLVMAACTALAAGAFALLPNAADAARAPS